MNDKILLDANSIPSNSFKSKSQASKDVTSERTKKKAIVSKEQVVSTKKPIGKKLASSFLSADGREVCDYVLKDRIIPGVKNLALDVLEMAFFNTSGGRRRDDRRYDDRASYNDYRGSYYRGNTYYDDRRRGDSLRDRDTRRRREYDGYDDISDYRNIILNDRRVAEDVVRELRRLIDVYDHTSIADLKELIGIPSDPIDNNWGWIREGDIGVRRVAKGFLIDVAPARYLD